MFSNLISHISQMSGSVVRKDNMSHRLLLDLVEKNKGKSIIFSPYSINYIMMMAYRGMDGKTKEEFENIYELDSSNSYDVVDNFIELDKTLQHDDLQSTNAKFVEQTYSNQFLSEFNDFLDKSKFEVHMCNFAENPMNEVKKINDWVSDKTHKLIPFVLEELNNDTKLVLVNTLYLKMDWLYKFDRSYERDFTKYDGSIEKVQMMYGRKIVDTKYFEDDDVQVVSLPYCKLNPNFDPNNYNTYVPSDYHSNGYSMHVVLPKNKGDNTLYDINSYIGRMELEETNVIMPEFETEFLIILNETFKNMGLKSLFNKGECDLGNMIQNSKDLFVSQIIHKAKIICNTKGTEAAAATAMVMERFCATIETKKPKEFIADHAFQYFIVHDESNTVLFSGVYNS